MPAHSTAEGRREEWTAAENGSRIALEANIGDVCMTRGGGDVRSRRGWFMDAP